MSFWEPLGVAVVTTLATNGVLASWRRQLRATRARVDRIAAGGCTVAPAGWICTRAPGHPGPCAALRAELRPSTIDPY